MHIPRKNRPAASVVVLSGNWGSPVEVDHFELTSNKDDLPTLLHELGSGLRSHLSGLAADRVVIRRADVQVASRKEGPRLRLLAEGAMAGAARSEVRDVILLPGKDLAAKSPATSKDDLDTQAAGRVPNSPVEAAAAALVGLSL